MLWHTVEMRSRWGILWHAVAYCRNEKQVGHTVADCDRLWK